MIEKTNIFEQLDGLTDHWSQQILTAANGSQFKVAKGIGATRWHQHADQDELFLVLAGHMTIELRTGSITLCEGDIVTIPKGVEHRPVAAEEVRFLIVGLTVTSTAAGGKPD